VSVTAAAVAPAAAAATQIKRAMGMVKHPDHANVCWEGFPSDKIRDLNIAFNRALRAGEQVVKELGTLAQRPLAVTLYRMWFGQVDPAAMPVMIHSATLMVVAMTTRPITFVLRNSVRSDYEEGPISNFYGVVHAGGCDFTSGPKVIPPHLEGTVGMSHELTEGGTKLLPHHTGSGMRVYLSDNVLADMRKDQISTDTIYHELTHKVLNTRDFARDSDGVVKRFYDRQACFRLAHNNPAHARQNAACWAGYAIAQL
jgi:hypothetical protein